MNVLLNEISNEGAAHLTEFYEQTLQAGPEALTAYEAHFNLGLLAWRAGDVGKLRWHLSNASKKVISIVENRNGENTQEPRIPHSVALPFLVIINFGSDPDRHNLAKLKRNQFIQPEDNRYQSLADLLDLLRAYFDGVPLNTNRIESILAINELEAVDRFYKPWVSAFAQGLQGVANKNEILAEKSMRYLLQLHEQLAREAGWQKLTEGLLSLWATTLQTVAKKEGIKLKIESAYLPNI